MRTYARLEDNKIFEFFTTDGDIDEIFMGGIWVDITDLDEKPSTGWIYNEGIFKEPEPPIVDRLPILNTRFSDIQRDSVSAIRKLILSSGVFNSSSSEYKKLENSEKEFLEVVKELETLNGHP